MDKFLLKVADWHNKILREKGLINDENYSDIDMVFREILYNAIVTAFFLLLGLLFGRFNEMLMMFLSFNIIRNFCGGWHSYGNLNFCIFLSIMVFTLSIFLAVISFNMFSFWRILAILSIIYIFYRAPYDKPEKQYQIYGMKFDSLMITTLFFILSNILNNLGLHTCATTILFAIIFSALLMNRKICSILEGLK